jgi:hypothetical protein
MPNSQALRPVTLSRDELYRRVWETPMSRLATEFGISGNGLAKICDRLDIPYPPRGYWARKEAGQRVVNFRLPQRGEHTPIEVTITPTPSPSRRTQAQEAAAADARSKAEGIEVPGEVKRLHPIIAGWLADHKDQRRRERLERNPFGTILPDWTESDHRQPRILDTIFRAVEKHGLTVKSEHRGTFYFEYKTEKISCRLREKNKQVRRPKTADEMRWSFAGDKNWTQVLEPTGNLIFTFEDYFDSELSIRREWLETQTKRLEEMVPDIIAALLLAGPALVKQRQDREEQRRRSEEAERQRQAEAARRRKDRNQWRALTEQADRHDIARKVRLLLSELEKQEADRAAIIGEKALSEWLIWAKRHLATFDPVERGIADVFTELSKVTDWTYRD